MWGERNKGRKPMPLKLGALYFRTTWRFVAHAPLEVPGVARIKRFSADEADRLAKVVGKRNIFARHARESDFYVRRLREMADKTVLEVLTNDEKVCNHHGADIADLVERVAFLSSTFSLKRPDVHRRLVIEADRGRTVDIAIGGRFEYVRSRSKQERPIRGIDVDARFGKRFQRYGFVELVGGCLSQHPLAPKLCMTLDWLSQSRQEFVLSAAVVKTAIALETLLVFSESEPLARSLSERAAFLLSNEASVRRSIAASVKRFYDVRSQVVHGGRRKNAHLSDHLLEGMDRIVLLLCLKIAANLSTLSSEDSLMGWCEDERWGAEHQGIARPFPAHALTSAVGLVLPKTTNS